MSKQLQINYFDLFEIEKENVFENYIFNKDIISLTSDKKRFEYYSVENYKNDVLKKGLEQTWDEINKYVLNNNTKTNF